MTAIQEANSDPLPTHSYFGLTNASTLCRGRDAKKCTAKFRPLETRLVTAPKYRISACLIQKNMSTLLRAIICYLYNERAFKAAGRVFATEYCAQGRMSSTTSNKS
ncbi:Protein C18B2.1 [Aphelenchoides avenae]|nr:Protein C18B2.1 [Aphelenchus avenae]